MLEAELEETVQAATADVVITLDEIYATLQTSFEFFINFFLGGDLTYRVPEFHKRVWAMMTGVLVKRVAIAVPRGHAKTTIAKLAVVWYFLFTRVKFIVYVCYTADLSEKAVNDIMSFMQSPNFEKVFGKIEFDTEKWGTGEFVFWVKTPFLGRKLCILKARGANSRIRGINILNQRPEMAIVDDLEDADDLDDSKLANKTRRWFFGTFIKALDRRVAKVIYIGNLLDNNCLLFKLTQSKYWTSMVLGALLKDGTPLWPDMWPVDKLIEDYQEYVDNGLSSLWFAEMMNLIIAGENALIKPEDIHYAEPVKPEKIKCGFITIDPATGEGNDNTAIAVHMLVDDLMGNLLPQTVDYRFGKIGELETVDTTFQLCTYWGVNVVAVESVAFQRALATLFEVMKLQKGFPEIEIIKTYPGHASKLMRLRSWCALLKSGGWLLTEGEMHITTELLQFDVTKENNRDDLADACASAPEVLKNYGAMILAQQYKHTMELKPVRMVELN